MRKNSQHNAIVANLRAQLKSKGFRLWTFSRKETKIAEYGYDPIKPKVTHSAFRPDIIISANDKLDDRFFLDYVHTEGQYRYDLKGMMELSNMVKGRAFILIINDEIFKLKTVEHIESIPLSLFENGLSKFSKEGFVRYLEG